MSRQFATPLVNNLVKSLHRMRLGPMEAWATSSAVTRLYGGSDGKASILIQHGAGGHGLLFSSVVTRFSPNAYAVSLPHHELDDLCASNETDEKAMLGNISDMAAVLEEALEQLPRPRILLGHSMGGAIAQTVALNNKVALDGLILYSTSSRLRVSAAIFDALRNPTGAVSADDFRYLFGPNVSTDLLDQQMDLRFLHNQQALSDFSACNSFDVMAQVLYDTFNQPSLLNLWFVSDQSLVELKMTGIWTFIRLLMIMLSNFD
eukprot:TRINITY_DN3082_c0_g1_i1.p1 TRINITY_DN3082_c0_g1~~TRINITY_DN3082_c0_g1_i1.p1  ORF type:complete len:262 (-),score=58.04 TRINITY_DN3082_c0_g1_i1:513-1298(-)